MKKLLSIDLLRASQLEIIDFFIDTPFCACFSDMGFGKTASVITAVEKLFKAKEVNRLLIVTTLKVAENTWPDEIKDWQHTSYLTFKVLTGDAKTRLSAAKGKEQIHIINQENFVWIAEKAGRTWPYDMVVFDDAEGLKNPNRKTKITKAICKHMHSCPIFEHEKSRVCKEAELCLDYTKSEDSEGCAKLCEYFKPVNSSLKVCIMLCDDFESPPARHTRFGALCALAPQIKRLIHLTGTPSNKGLVDIWPLIFTLDGGKRLRKTYTQYKNQYFNKSHNGFSWELKPDAEMKIHAKIKDLCIAVESEAKLPECDQITKTVKLPDNAARLYDQFERDLIIDIEDEEIEAANNGVLAGKLLQVCGGAVYTGTEREWVELHNEKIIQLGSLINRFSPDPILVGYNFEHELIRLKKAFPYGIDIRERRDAVHAWNAGDIPLMFVHPGSAGHGLNLQKGPGRVLVWFGLNWRLDYNKQLNKRLWRPGQKRKVYIFYLVAEGRADTRLMEGVAKYDWTQQQLLNAVKRDATNKYKKDAL